MSFEISGERWREATWNRIKRIDLFETTVAFTLITLLFVTIGSAMIFYLWASVWTTSPGLGGTFTLEGYHTVLTNPTVHSTILNTLILGVFGTTLAVLIGVVTMVYTIKMDAVGSRVVALILLIQYLLPSYIVAMAWRMYAGASGPVNDALRMLPFVTGTPININSIWMITFIFATHYAGLVYLLTSAAIKAVPPSLEEAGDLAGAPKVSVLRRITLKLAIPSLVISVVLIFARALQSFSLPLILGLPDRTYVVATLMYVELAQYPPNYTFAAAIGTLILFASVVGLAIQRRIAGEQEKYELLSGSERREVLKLKFEKYQWLVSGVFWTFFFAVYVMPFVMVFIATFQQNFLGFEFSEVEWTLDNWMRILIGARSDEFYHVVKNTAIVGGLGGFLGMILSVLISYFIVKTDKISGTILDYLHFTPVAIPGIILGTAILILIFTFETGLQGTLWLIMFALILKFLHYGVRAANSSFRAIGSELEEAAELSGAGKITIFRRIHLPLLKTGFLSGYIILFIDFTKSLSIPILLTGSGNEIIQIFIWNLLRQARTPEAAVVTMVLIGFIIGVYAAAWQFFDIDMTEL